MLAGTVVKTIHIAELRTALEAAFVAAGRTPPTFSDAVIGPRQTAIKAVHITELRNAVLELER